MVVDVLGGWPGVLGVVAVVLGAAGFWRWGRTHRTTVPLTRTARRAWRERAPPSATLSVEVDEDVAVYADADELDALLGECFENAVVYGGDGVAVRLTPTEIGFAVADDGPGIPPEQSDDAFEMGGTTRPNRDGIGLALVESVCAGNGWDVSLAESEAGGTRVVVSNVTFHEGWGREETGETAVTRTSEDPA